MPKNDGKVRAPMNTCTDIFAAVLGKDVMR